MPQEVDGSILATLFWFIWCYWIVWNCLCEGPPGDQTDLKDKLKAISADESSQIADVPYARAPLNHGSACHDRHHEVSGLTEALSEVLSEIRHYDHSFVLRHFLEKAAATYEIVIVAFTTGDRMTLRRHVSREIYDVFLADIVDRENKDEHAEKCFLRVGSPQIVDAGIHDDQAEIAVRFASELFSMTRNASGAVVRGDPARMIETVDVWTFGRALSSSDPAWRLIASNAAAEPDTERWELAFGHRNDLSPTHDMPMDLIITERGVISSPR
jgi:predicted lipid-binding transport protein (Tim44 family)